MDTIKSTTYESRDVRFQIWEDRLEGSLSMPTRAIKSKPLCH